MDIVESIISSIDSLLNTSRKRHIMGGILLSASMMFGGLALTTMTIKTESEAEHEVQSR